MLVLSALLLVGVLGLAYVQVRMARALGPYQEVAGTPLRVRLPHRWKPMENRRGSFALTVERRGERRLHFYYQQRPGFTSVARLVDELGLADSADLETLSTARIGDFDAVQVRLTNWQRQFGFVVKAGEELVRLASLPDGNLIHVVYEPLGDIGPADEEIFDGVCRSLEIDDPRYAQPRENLLNRVGVDITLDDEERVVAPRIDGVPGFYIGGSLEGVPTWSLGVFRTWLGLGRTPQDLLMDLAADQWLEWDRADDVVVRRRSDGATMARLRHARYGLTEEELPEAWVISTGPDTTVILFVRAGARDIETASRAAEEIAETLQIQPLEDWPSIAAAESAGKTLVRRLTERGAVPRWGREPITATYVGQTLRGRQFVQIHRQAVGRDPTGAGYEGSMRQWLGTRSRREPDQVVEWTLDGQAAVYVWKLNIRYKESAVRMREVRRVAEGPVVRELAIPELGARDFRYQPGAAFVPSPAAEILAGWVARGDLTPAALIEESSIWGSGTHTTLLRTLPPENGQPRVLTLTDYWPLGSIHAFDDDAAITVQEMYPTALYQLVESDDEGAVGRRR